MSRTARSALEEEPTAASDSEKSVSLPQLYIFSPLQLRAPARLHLCRLSLFSAPCQLLAVFRLSSSTTWPVD